MSKEMKISIMLDVERKRKLERIAERNRRSMWRQAQVVLEQWIDGHPNEEEDDGKE